MLFSSQHASQHTTFPSITLNRHNGPETSTASSSLSVHDVHKAMNFAHKFRTLLNCTFCKLKQISFLSKRRKQAKMLIFSIFVVKCDILVWITLLFFKMRHKLGEIRNSFPCTFRSTFFQVQIIDQRQRVSLKPLAQTDRHFFPDADYVIDQRARFASSIFFPSVKQRLHAPRITKIFSFIFMIYDLFYWKPWILLSPG